MVMYDNMHPRVQMTNCTLKKKMTNLYIVNICINENEKGDETR